MKTTISQVRMHAFVYSQHK